MNWKLNCLHLRIITLLEKPQLRFSYFHTVLLKTSHIWRKNFETCLRNLASDQVYALQIWPNKPAVIFPFIVTREIHDSQCSSYWASKFLAFLIHSQARWHQKLYRGNVYCCESTMFLKLCMQEHLLLRRKNFFRNICYVYAKTGKEGKGKLFPCL